MAQCNYTPILKLSIKSQIEIPSPQQHLLPKLIHNLSRVLISILLIDLLGLHQTSMHQLIDVLHTLNLSGTITSNSL